MKSIRIVALMMIMISLAGMSMAQKGVLNLEITNIKTLNGDLIVAIYNNRSDFPKEGKEFKKLILKVDKKIMTYSIKGLPQDEYAIALLHDENSDGKCNNNKLGFPLEGYGFSNNIKPLFSAPPFRKAKFQLNKSTRVKIALIH